MLNGNRFVNNCTDNFDEPSPDILEERFPTPVINEPIEEHSPVMDVENSFFVNPEAAPRSCAPTASSNPPPRLTEPTSSVAFEQKLPAEGEQIIVTGPICPVCGKSFATKNVSESINSINIIIKNTVLELQKARSGNARNDADLKEKSAEWSRRISDG